MTPEARHVLIGLPGHVVAAMLTLLAIAVLRARPRDTANRAFAAFLGVVALNYVLVGLSDATNTAWASGQARPAISRTLLNSAYVVQTLDPIALVWFLAILTGRKVLRSPWVIGPLLLVAAGACTMLLGGPGVDLTFNRLGLLVYDAYVSLVYIGALVVLLRSGDVLHGPFRERLLLGWGVLAFLRLVPGVFAHIYYLTDIRAKVPFSHPTSTLVTAGTSYLLLLVVIAIFGAVAGLGDRSRVREAHRLAIQTAAWCGALLLVLNSASIFATLAYGPYDDSAQHQPLLHAFVTVLDASRYPIRWLFFAALAGPAFLSMQVFDIDLRLRRWVLTGVVGAWLFLLAGASALIIESTFARNAGFGARVTLVLALLALGASQSVHLGRAVSERWFPSSRERDEAYRLLRKIEVYRDAVRAAREGRLDEADVDHMRRSLGISQKEARAAEVLSGGEQRERPISTGTIIAERFEVLGNIGRGGRGDVFRARDRKTGVEVAIKQIVTEGQSGSSALARLDSEIASARKLASPRVLLPHDFVFSGSTAFLVSEFAPGGSLADRLRTTGALAPREAGRVTLDVLEALASAHAEGILHRDVKPANVLLGRDGRAKLADFGVALLRDAGVTMGTDVIGPPLAGTVPYLPPEAFSGAPADPSWDLYATGTLLFEALTRSLPGPADPPAGLAFANVIRRARAPGGERYHNAQEMTADLRRELAALNPT